MKTFVEILEEATFEKVGSLTKDQAKKCSDNKGSICVTNIKGNEIEIHDMRSLKDRVKNSITGNGVIKTFGDTHFIVSKDKLEKLKKIADVVEIMNEASGDKEAYTKYFEKILKKYKVSSPAELSDEDKKKFFDEVDKGWESDEE